MKDVEVLLRGLAMLMDGDNYAPSMVKFLNQFSRQSRGFARKKNEYLYSLLESFFDACAAVPRDAFLNKRNKRFNVALFEAAFAAVCQTPFERQRTVTEPLSAGTLAMLENDKQFLSATTEGTTQTKNVKLRLRRAVDLLGR
jgi:hypothetical protein